MSERRPRVLHVVVQRPIDVGNVADGQGGQRDPVVVIVRELRRGEGQCELEQTAGEQRRRARHRVGHKQGQEARVVVPAGRPVGVGGELAVGPDNARVAVDELRVAHRVHERPQLVGVPDVVLVGHRHEGGRGRHQRQGALEVLVEAAPPRRARDQEALVGRDHLLDRGEALRVGAIVADDAHPVAVALGADRLDLTREQVHRRLEGGHHDRDEGAARGLGRLGLQPAG